MDRTNSHRARRTALLSASALALVFAAAPERAQGQTFDRGFQGTPTVNAGSVTVSTGVNATTVDVGSSQAVVTWTPSSTTTSGTIDFLPSTTTATFTSSLSDYTILNRIIPGGTATIGLNGTIRSFVSPGAEQLPVTGGNVWFYTPNGFVIGGGAVITVGGLLLSTNDISYSVNANGGVSFTNANGATELRGPAGSTASIINNGTISASNYVAMVSPRIEQNGLISASRSIAYVAGEQVDLTINAGMFEIAVLSGTTDANGVVHTGTTTGSASTGSADTKTISFVAIPKNEAMTMLLSGNIGYAPASNAFSDGSTIVLVAGDANSPAGNIRIGEGEFVNGVNGRATGDLTVAPAPPGPSSEGAPTTFFRSSTNLEGGQSVNLTAASGTRIQADNGINLSTGNDAAAGAITVEAIGAGLGSGTIAVTGELTAIAQHEGGTSEDGLTGTDAQGGTVAVRAIGGTISAGSIYASASARGGYGALQGGDGTGGSVELASGFGGTITTGSTAIYANGDGGQASGFVNDEFVLGRGGVGRGGSIQLADSLGDLTTDPDGGALDLEFLYLSASAVGGNSSFGEGLGGDAFGGTIDVLFDRRDQSLSSIYGYATARDGDAALDPIGGDITFAVGGGISVDLSELYLDTSASSGINGPQGSFSRGGTIDLSVTEGAVLRTEFSLGLVSRADTVFFFFDSLPNSTADLTGGDITVTADGGMIEAGFIDIDVGAYNYGATTRAGFAHGGTVSVTAANGGSVGTRAQDGEATPEFEISADAYSGVGEAVGESRGGSISLAALSGGSIVAPGINIVLEAAGETGIISAPSTNGAPAFGGSIAIDAIGGAVAAPIEAYAFGEGGTADLDGGSGTGGTIAVRVLEGGEITGTLIAQAYGTGGQSLTSGDGGDGRGGSLSLTSDASATFTTFSLDFDGYGQGGQAAEGTGGDGFGGSAQIDIIGGTHSWSTADLSAYARGASSQVIGSLAGSAFGDVVGVQFHVGGGGSLLISGTLSLDATAFTGSNGGANQAIGGAAGVLVDGGASLTADAIYVGSTGYLGEGEFNPLDADSTPTVRGGTSSLVADGGSVSAAYIEILSEGDTSGALTAAGTATGGNAILGAANGGSIAITGTSEGGLVIGANGYGTEGPSAAHAFGGTATVYTQGGTITSPYALEVRADAMASGSAGQFDEFGIPSSGFDTTGGTASVEMRAGGSGTGAITVPSLTISASGLSDSIGSIPGDGGDGTGGTATLSVAEGDLTVDFGLRVLAEGLGGAAEENGDGTSAFAGGDGQGGTASFILSGGRVETTTVGVSAVGSGADGVGFNSSATPSLAGNGVGGDASFTASGGTLVLSGEVEATTLQIDGSGIGGAGAFNPNGAVGGTGGTGSGGSALFSAPPGSTAALMIPGPISVVAEGIGGSAGLSINQAFGVGGNATGGSAAIRLADIPFAFDQVFVSGSGYGGFGAPGGTGTGGSAEFSIIDSGSAAATRSIGQLTLLALGANFVDVTPSGVGGSIVFASQAGNVASGLLIDGDLLFDASGAIAPAGNGFTGTISGAPVTVGGTAQILTPRDAALAITAPGALAVDGNLTIDVGRSFTSTGPISTLANASVLAPGGISMTDLSAGGTTELVALNGPVTVSTNLVSGGPVTVLGRTVNLVSLGALSFADADATAGPLSIRTAGNLDVVTVDSTGAIVLNSTGGTIHSTGAVNGTDLTFIAAGDVITDTVASYNGNLTVDAGGFFITPTSSASATGNVSLSADLGLTLASVVSGGTTLLQADAGAVNVASLTSPGAVTASGRSVAITSAGALNFASAQATAGDLQLTTGGNLAVAQGGASGNLSLTSSGGSISGTGPIVVGGTTAISAANGIALGTLTSGGTTSLLGNLGTVAVTNLNSAGPVTARGTAVTIGSSGALSFADLDATAGNVSVQTAGDLAVGTVDATGSITLISTGGSLLAGGVLNGVGITLGSFNNLTLANALATSGAISLTSTNGSVSAANPVTAAGNLAVAGFAGVTLGTATSGGTTTLSALNGAIAVSALTSPGAVTASGRSVTIASPGALSVASAQATAGNLSITTAQALSVGAASATGTLTLSAGGILATTGAVSGAGIALSGTNVTTGGPVQSSAALTMTASQLLTVNALATGSAITAAAADIAIGATGRLGSRGLTGSLTITNRDAARPIYFGGTGASGQFSLDSSEATRLFADQQIAIVASSQGTGGEIRIGNLAMNYGTASTANIGSGGTLKIDTAGNVFVNGAVALTTSSANDTFSIDPSRIEVVAGTGSIAMLGTGSTPLGSLVLEGGTTVVADQSVIDAIESSTDLMTINKLLDQPTATRSENGFLQAGSIDLLAGSALYIQNTGTSTANNARRGFTAGAVNIDTSSSETRISINGVITGSTGTLTGGQAANGITINGETAIRRGAFDPLSTINGCLIGSSCTSQSIPTSSDLESPADPDDAGDRGNAGDSGMGFQARQLIQLDDNEPLITPPLVDEPITGIGNDDLWQVHCEDEDDKSSCSGEEGETD
ncbi:beta strand repeat-containing protein [Tsuneonella sp. HG249]